MAKAMPAETAPASTQLAAGMLVLSALILGARPSRQLRRFCIGLHSAHVPRIHMAPHFAAHLARADRTRPIPSSQAGL